MKLRERIDEIKRMKGVCLQVESDVTEYIIKPILKTKRAQPCKDVLF